MTALGVQTDTLLTWFPDSSEHLHLAQVTMGTAGDQPFLNLGQKSLYLGTHF